MKKFIIRQTVEIDLQWAIEANSREEALEQAWGDFDDTKITDLVVLDWEKPWDAEEIDMPVSFVKESDLKPWREIGILPQRSDR